MLTDDDSNDDESVRLCPTLHRRNDTRNETIKCFILTPSSQYVNPAFKRLRMDDTSNRAKPFLITSSKPLTLPSTLPRNVSPTETVLSSLLSPHASPVNLFGHAHFSPAPTFGYNELNLTDTHLPASPPDYTSPGSPVSLFRTPLSPSQSDFSLGVLTKEFVRMLRTSPDNSVDFNRAASELKVQKRRIYDIANVLEGIGILLRKGKNHVYCWNDNPLVTAAEEGTQANQQGGVSITSSTESMQSSEDIEEMKDTLEQLKEEEVLLDKCLDFLKNQAEIFAGRRPPTKKQRALLPEGVRDVSDHMFVRFEDITTMPDFKSDTVIGIRAPNGTAMESPGGVQGTDPGTRRYHMYLNSTSVNGGGDTSSRGEKREPVDVYLVRPTAKQAKGSRKQECVIQKTVLAPNGNLL